MLINSQQHQQVLSSRPATSPPIPLSNFDYINNNNNNNQPIPLFGGLGGGQLFNSGGCGGGIFPITTTATTTTMTYPNLIQQNNNNLNKTTNNTIFQNQENICVGSVGNNGQINGQSIPGAWFFPPQQSVAELDHAGLDSPCSPGLMAPQQLLARFGPRHSTDSVEVPSSEHVAEIVGRQGCKIKALRAKTNTYIKTPVRGEEPVFVVTGRHEDVIEARREIECAAEHFTQIRASRRHSQGACPAPGHVTAYVRVPLRVVGLVVGPKGNTIKRIQQDTHTYIITPSREREPIFEVTGLPENVEAARREIENHIYQRTGNMPITDPNASIANFDLNSAALQAQQAALQSNSSNRPNYGALAVVCPRNMNMLNGKDSSPYYHQNGGVINSNHFTSNGYGQTELEHYYSNKSGLILNGCGQPSSTDLHNSTTSNSASSSNDLHLFFNSLELDGPINCGGNGSIKVSNFGAIGDPHPTSENKRQFGSTFSSNGGSDNISNNSNSAFSPWTTTTIELSSMNNNIGVGEGIGGVSATTTMMMMNGLNNENNLMTTTTTNNNNGGDLFDIFASTTTNNSSSPLAFSFSNGTKCY